MKIVTAVWNFIVTSSENPEKTSATWSGVILILASLLNALAAHFGVVFGTAEFNDNLTSLAAGVGALVTLFGIVRKASNAIDAKLNQ